MKNSTKFITIIVVMMVASFMCASQGEYKEGLAFGLSSTLAALFSFIPEKKDKSKIKGVVQFDKENYDVPAMRFLFYEEPMNLINYEEVTFKVDRNAIIKNPPAEWGTIDIE